MDASPDRDRCAEEDDPYEAEPSDLVIPLEGRLEHVATEHAEKDVAHEGRHQRHAQPLDDHATLRLRELRPARGRRAPCRRAPAGSCTRAAPAAGTPSDREPR